MPNFIRYEGRLGFTLVEILIVSGILAFLGLFIGQLFLGGSRQFNESLWRNQTQQSLDAASVRINKLLREASYPTLNTFQGTVRDKRAQFFVEVKTGNLNAGEAYSTATINLADGDPQVDSGAAQTLQFFGSGTKTGLSEATGNKISIMEWVTCDPGYRDVPGFEGAPNNPLCGTHELYLEGTKRVLSANTQSYGFYSELYLETRYSYTGVMNPTNVLQGEGNYNPSYQTAAGGNMTPEQRGLIGKKRLASGVATLAVKVYAKDNDRSRTVELDIVCVAPWMGNAVIRKTFQANVGVTVNTP